MASINENTEKEAETSKVIQEIGEKYDIDLLALFDGSKVECNQCHANCNDCGWDR
jgi:hypothetical protein